MWSKIQPMDISSKMNQMLELETGILKQLLELCFKNFRENTLKMKENIGNLRRKKFKKKQKVIL